MSDSSFHVSTPLSGRMSDLRASAISPNREGGIGSPSIEKLSKLRDNLHNVYGDIREAQEHRRIVELNKLEEIRDYLAKNEKNLALEIKRRTEADQVLQSMFEGKLEALQMQLEKTMTEQFSQIQMNFEMINKRLAQLERDLQDERESKTRALENATSQIYKEIANLQTQLENERVSRLEKEAQIMKKFSDDIFHLDEKIDTEKLVRDTTITELKDEVTKYNRNREKLDEKFQTRILEEIDILKTGLRLEAETREHSEENLATTIHDLMNDLQEGLLMAGRGPSQ